MDSEMDLGLDRTQWETLKALGAPDAGHRRLDRLAFQHLVASRLAAIDNGRPVITAMGRTAVVRGSPRLWDLSA